MILAASKKSEYAKLIDTAVAYGKEVDGDLEKKTDATLDRLLVEFGKEILKVVPGKVSTEVDARFSFDTKATINKALRIIDVCYIPYLEYRSLSIAMNLMLINFYLALQARRYRQVPHLDQDCIHLGRYPSRSYPST